MIDLHTHTTASDGRCTPEELAARASAAGVTVLAVSDHDTTAACPAAAVACARLGMAFVAGIEITAVVDELDVHVLGYFLDLSAPPLQRFLEEQRRRRVDRVCEMVERLAQHGITLDLDHLLAPALAHPGASVGRPLIARQLVARGYVTDVLEAFDRWLSKGQPAFVPRQAADPPEVFERIHEAGGIASLAHPGLLKHDEWIGGYAARGLDAIEAYHSDHDQLTTTHYLALAHSLGLAVSGGSDYHGDDGHGGGLPGRVSLPQPDYDRLRALKDARG